MSSRVAGLTCSNIVFRSSVHPVFARCLTTVGNMGACGTGLKNTVTLSGRLAFPLSNIMNMPPGARDAAAILTNVQRAWVGARKKIEKKSFFHRLGTPLTPSVPSPSSRPSSYRSPPPPPPPNTHTNTSTPFLQLSVSVHISRSIPLHLHVWHQAPGPGCIEHEAKNSGQLHECSDLFSSRCIGPRFSDTDMVALIDKSWGKSRELLAYSHNLNWDLRSHRDFTSSCDGSQSATLFHLHVVEPFTSL